jgi:hypothetical protein
VFNLLEGEFPEPSIIFSVPELLEACEDLLAWIGEGPLNQDNPYKKGGCVEKALTAIDKTKGE